MTIIIDDNFKVEFNRFFTIIKNNLLEQGKINENTAKDLTQNLLNQLLFLFSIQYKGWLKGEKPKIYLYHLFERYLKYKSSNDKLNFYRDYLSPLFFKAFKQDYDFSKTLLPVEIIEEYKHMPYLNSEMFRKNQIKDLGLSLSDDVIKKIFDIYFKKYNFSLLEDKPIEQEIDHIIQSLNEFINELMTYAKEVDADVWENILEIKNLEDDANYKDEEERKNARYRGAAFVALAQLLFYIILRTSRIIENRNENPTLKALNETNGEPKEIQEYIEIISDKINYNAIYKFKVFNKFPKDSSELLIRMILKLEGFSSDLVIQNDLIGLLFQKLIPFDLRKKLAAYYTKPLAAELLTKLIFETGNESVLDPACGSGTLLVHSYLQKKRIKGDKASHEKLLSEIMGSDISVFATILASVNLAIQDPGKLTNKVNIFNENAFNLPKAHIGKYFKDNHFIYKFKKQTSEGTEIIESPGLLADVIIMNPPFTRGSRLTEEERKILLKVSTIYGLKHGWRDWNLYASFILLAPEFLPLKSSGKIGLVLPRSAIATKYMEKVWEKLFERYPRLDIKYIINASMTEVSFSDSSEQEILLIIERNYSGPCKLIQLKKEMKEYDLQKLSEEIINIESSNILSNLENFEGQIIKQTEFKKMKCREWSFSLKSIIESIYSNFIPIESLDFVIAGGGNSSKPVDYFWLPNKFWDLKTDSDAEVILNQTFEAKKILNSLLREIPEVISLSKKFLIKSLVRNLDDMVDQPPYFNNNYPFIYFLNYNELSKNPQNNYFNWGELLRGTLDSWVCAPPRSAIIFIPVKIRLNTMKSIAIRSPDLLDSARVAGIIFIPKDSSPKPLKLMDVLFAYLTSSIYLLDYIRKARIVSGALRQLFSTDLKSLMKFPNILNLKEEEINLIIDASNKHNKHIPLKNRPAFPELISNALDKKNKSTLRELDEIWFKILKIPMSSLDTLYQDLKDEFLKIITNPKGKATTKS